MEIKEFAQKVCHAAEKSFGENHVVELREVRKNNGVLLHGLTVQAKGQNVAPTVYLEHFFRAYQEGMTFAEIMEKLMAVYRQDTPACNVDMEFFRDFSRVCDRICYRLVGSAGNGELLENIPHVEFLDLAVCFYYAYSGEVLGEGSILVHNSHMKEWGTSVAELMELAKQNTPRLFPAQCSTMEEVLQELLNGKERGILPGREVPLKVLTNSKRIHGAVCLIYQGMLEQIAEELDASLYILPSSVHEVILLAEDGVVSSGELKEMVMQVNRTQVAPEEVLSDSVYWYDRGRKRVERVL